MLKELIRKNRSYRRFYEEVAVDRETLQELINLARLSASAANKQPLKYMISTERKKNEVIFSSLAWAGYLKEWDGPEEGERPAAYIIMLADNEINPKPQVDAGIAAQSILLGASEKGLGGCIFGSVKRNELREALQIEERYTILFVLALGKAKEDVVLEEVGADGNIKYWRDSEGVHHVPKRSLEQIIID